MREVARLAHVYDRDVSGKRRVVEGQDIVAGRQKQRLPAPAIETHHGSAHSRRRYDR
jgi:hypothetical protein